MKSKIAVCASGDGSNFESIVQASRAGKLQAEVVGLIVNRPGIGSIERARRLGIPCSILPLKDFADRNQWDLAMVAQLEAWNVDWIALAGFLALIGPHMLGRFPGRIVNTHPALLPKYGGKGMYGHHVHAAVIEAGERETGVTVHLIDGEFDRGRIVYQEKVPLLPDDTVETLSARLKAAENALYPRVLNDLVTGRITIG